MTIHSFSKIQKSVIACLCIMGLGLGMVNFSIQALESPVPDPVLQEISFNSFGITDGTHEYEGATELNASGQYSDSLNGTLFSGNITITGSAGIDIRYGGKDMAWLGLRFYTKDGNLCVKDVQDRTDEYIFMSGAAGTQLIGAQFNIKISTQFVDSDLDGQTDDVKLGVWFNSILYKESYIYLADYASALGNWMGIFVTEPGVSISVASVQPSTLAVPDTTLRKLSFRNFGIANDTFFATGDLNERGSYSGSLDGTIFSGNLTFSGSAQKDIRIGGAGDYWNGLRFYNSGSQLCMQDVESRTPEYVFMPDIAQTEFENTKFNLKVSFQFVDSDLDGTKDDVRLGVWFNDILYNNRYIYLTNYATLLGSKLGVYVSNGSSSITIESEALSEPEVPIDTLKRITFLNFGIADATYQFTGGLSASGQYSGSLNGTIFSGDVTFTGPSAADIRYGGENLWYGLRFYNSGENLYMTDADNRTAEYGFTPAMAGTQLVGAKFNLKITTQFVDADKDGVSDDVKLGVWFNEMLYENNYIYLMNYAPYMGRRIGIYVSDNNSSLTTGSSNSGSQLEVMDPDLETITFRNFLVADGTYRFDERGLSASGEYGKSLDGKVLAGDITFGGAGGEQLIIGGLPSAWHGLCISAQNDGTLFLYDAIGQTQKYVLSPVIAGTPLTGTKINLKLSFRYMDADSDGEKDDVKLGVWINNTLYANEYMYLTDYASVLGSKMGVYIEEKQDSYIILESVPLVKPEQLDPSLREITFRNFNIADGSYYFNNNDLSVKGRYNGTLNNTVLSGYITYSGSPGEQIRFAGKESEWHGLLFGSDADGTLYLAEASERFAKITFHPEMAEIPLTGKRFNLKLSIQFVDSDADGRDDDVKVGVWFNNVLYANEYIYLTDYAKFVGNWMSLYISKKENTEVHLESLPYGKRESLDPALNMITFKQFHIADGKCFGNGDLSKKGAYSVPLDQSVFSGNVFYSGKGVEEIRFYGKDSGWSGLRIFSKGDGNLYLADEPALNPEYQFSPGIAGTKLTGKMLNLKLSIQFVDYDSDQKRDDIQLGVWFNDQLYANEYIYFTDYVSVLGSYIGIYIADKDSFIEIQSVIKLIDFSVFGLSANWEKDLFEQTGSDKPSEASGSTSTPSSPNTSDSAEIMWTLMSVSLSLIVLVGRTNYLKRNRR